MLNVFELLYNLGLYSNDLDTHMRGFDNACEGFNATKLYPLVFFYTFGTALFVHLLFYFGIGNFSVKLSSRLVLWILLLLVAVVSFLIGTTLPYRNEVCETLKISSGDIFYLGLENALYGAIIFGILTLLPWRRISRNARNVSLF